MRDTQIVAILRMIPTTDNNNWRGFRPEFLKFWRKASGMITIVCTWMPHEKAMFQIRLLGLGSGRMIWILTCALVDSA